MKNRVFLGFIVTSLSLLVIIYLIDLIKYKKSHIHSELPITNTAKLLANKKNFQNIEDKVDSKSNKLIENHSLYSLINIVKNPNFSLEYQLDACDKLSLAQKLEPFMHTIMANTLLTCRSKKNSYGVTHNSIEEKVAVYNDIKSKGWQSVIDKIQSGELSLSRDLQAEKKPMHNLLSTFAAAGVEDIEAYEALVAFGVEPNAIFLSDILLNNDYKLLNFYEKHADIYAVNDMQRNIVFSAAAFGDLNAMGYFLDKGVPYQDKLGRDPLAFHLSRFGMQVNAKQLNEFVKKYDIKLNRRHLKAAYEIQASTELIQLIKSKIADQSDE